MRACVEASFGFGAFRVVTDRRFLSTVRRLRQETNNAAARSVARYHGSGKRKIGRIRNFSH